MSFGYQKVLFGKGAPIAALLEVVDGAKLVDTDYGSKNIIVKEDADISFELVPEDSVHLPDTIKSTEYEEFHKVATERDQLRAEKRQLEKQLEEIKKAANKEEKGA